MKTRKALIKPEDIDEKSELDQINAYTRRTLTQEEVYTFSVVLCDNDIDRDFERFDTQALYKLAELFVGKTGVFDHDPKAQNQAARIFSCKVEQVPGQKTKTNEDYYQLTARAYLPKTEKNQEFITFIDSGIHKEVSVGCAVGEVVCSICGENRRTSTCSHLNSKEYNGQVCHSVLKQPTDAYEWSFVAVPAQPKAGVVKAYAGKQKEEQMEQILKSLNNANGCTLNKQQTAKLLNYIEMLKQQCADGAAYRAELTKEANRLSYIVQPEIAEDVMTKLTPEMSIKQLKSVVDYYQAKAQSVLPVKPQLSAEKKGKDVSGFNENYKEYSI